MIDTIVTAFCIAVIFTCCFILGWMTGGRRR